MPAATDKVANDNTLYIVVPAQMNTGEAKKLDITLKEQNSSTTQTDSYIIHVNVSKMQYPVTVIEKNPTRWTEDGQTRRLNGLTAQPTRWKAWATRSMPKTCSPTMPH